MHLIFCIEDNDGLAFCGRRLSRDREVYAHILRFSNGHPIWSAPCSSGLFPEDSVIVDPDFLLKASDGDYCFVETAIAAGSVQNLESVILYRWNRRYPSTEKFPRELLRGMELVHTEEFAGYSHEKITMERFAL